MADTLYLIGIDPSAARPLCPTPVLNPVFEGAPRIESCAEALKLIEARRAFRFASDHDSCSQVIKAAERNLQ